MHDGKPGRPILIQIGERATGKELARYPHPATWGWPHSSFSPDLQTIASTVTFTVGDGREQTQIAPTRTVLKEASIGRALLTISDPKADHRARGFSPDSQTFVTASGRHDYLWETSTGKERLRFTFEGDRYGPMFSPDGRTIAVYYGTAPGFELPYYIELRDVITGKVLLRLTGFEQLYGGPAFSPDGRLLASSQNDCTILTWDVSSVTCRPSRSGQRAHAQELESWWADLAGQDARKAHSAIWAMAAVPDQAVPLLRDRLRPASPPALSIDQVKRLAADLDSDQFQRRENAFEQLKDLGERAEPALQEILDTKPTLEQRRRIEQLLTGPRRPPAAEELRSLRAVEVLEHTGTPEARAVLKRLTSGSQDVRLTKNSKAALHRLVKRPPLDK
jgi:hypothetical protein